jgi:hypothetical protein
MDMDKKLFVDLLDVTMLNSFIFSHPVVAKHTTKISSDCGLKSDYIF